MTERAAFLASFPCIQSAIKVYGDKQGMRVQLDIPEDQMSEALKILAWRECVLSITVEPCKAGMEQGSGKEPNNVETRPKRKPKWETP